MTKLLRKYRFELWHCRPQLWLAQPTRPRLQPANHRRRPGTLLRHTWRIGIPQGQKSSYFHPEWRISPQNPRNSVVAAARLSETRSSSGSISSLLRWKDRRKTAVSQQQYLDKVDRLLISWVTNHLGFSSCLPSVFCIPPTWALRAAAVIRDFINGFYQNIPSYPRDAARLSSSYLNVTLQYLQVSCSSLSCDISRYVTHKLKIKQHRKLH